MRSNLAVFVALTLLALTTFIGCKSIIPCDVIEKPAVDFVSNKVIMGVCSCADAAQVSAFVVSKIPKNIQDVVCPASGSSQQRGVVGSILCEPLIKMVGEIGCSKIPSCSGANMDNAQIQLLIDKCKSSI